MTKRAALLGEVPRLLEIARKHLIAATYPRSLANSIECMRKAQKQIARAQRVVEEQIAHANT